MSTPNGVRYTRLRLRDGYAVTHWGRVVGCVFRHARGWEWVPYDGSAVWGTARTRADAAQCLIDAAPIR